MDEAKMPPLPLCASAPPRETAAPSGRHDGRGPEASSPPPRRLDVLVSALVCLAVLVGLDVAFRTSRLRRTLDQENHFRRRVVEYEKLAPPPDVVFIGDSRILHGLDPAAAEEVLREELGEPLAAYNLALSGAPPIAHLTLVGLALSRSPPPRAVVLFVSPYMVSTRIEPMLSRESLHTVYRLRDVPWMVRARARTEDVLDVLTSNLFVSLRYRARLVRLLFEAEWPGPPAEMGRKGFQPIGPAPPAVQQERARSRANGYRTELGRPAARVGEEQLGYLDATLTRLEQAGVPVAVVNTTSASALLEIYGPDSIYGEYLRRVRALVSSHGAPFHDHLRNPVTSDLDFVDGDHMSADGARKYTRWVAAEVILPLLREE